MKNKVIADGYLRNDGRLGIRNRALVVYLSGCAEFVAKTVAERFLADSVEVLGCPGCRDNPDMDRKLTALALHQNVGAVLAIGNGCEPFKSEALAEAVSESGRPAAHVNIREAGSISNAIERGVALLNMLVRDKDKVSRASIRYSDLVIGAECGGSDFTSGLYANPLVGRLFDRLGEVGATLIFEEMYECVGLREYLANRCENDRVAEDMRRVYDRYFSRSESDAQFFISPGNVRGGLTTIEEKSMGAVVKSGSRPITGIIRPAERPPYNGLWMMDGMGDDELNCGFSASEDASSTLLMVSCGAHMTILTSGRGHLINNPVGPTIKVTGNHRTYQNLFRDMDFNASPRPDSADDLTEELAEYIAEVSAGRQTLGEALGHREAVIYYEHINRRCNAQY